MTEKEAARESTRFESGSDNLFADIGLSDAEESLAKARLAEALEETMEHRGLTQAEAAKIMGVDQPTISRIVNGRLDGFTQERLMRYLTALGDDVEIIIRRPDRYDAEGHLTVTIG